MHIACIGNHQQLQVMYDSLIFLVAGNKLP